MGGGGKTWERKGGGEPMISSFLFGLSAGMILTVLIYSCGMSFLEARDKKLEDKRRQRNEKSAKSNKF